MKKVVIIICSALLLFAQNSIAADYHYVSAQELKVWLEAAKPVLLVDIQEQNDFAVHHINGSLETNAYPVKSDAERQTLVPAVDQSKNYETVVVVCPRGKGGAKRTYNYLKENGVPETKLAILTGGMENWPYQEWVATK